MAGTAQKGTLDMVASKVRVAVLGAASFAEVALIPGVYELRGVPIRLPPTGKVLL